MAAPWAVMLSTWQKLNDAVPVAGAQMRDQGRGMCQPSEASTPQVCEGRLGESGTHILDALSGNAGEGP